ncbi:MAG: exodeoxyribonuclease VII large subunit [Fluviicola sp.]
MEHFTLKQVADSLQKTIAERYARTYWVSAEMNKLNLSNKGHCFPELVQKENDVIIAQLNATIWKTTFQSIKRKFETSVGEPISDGMQLLLNVKINFSPLYGLSLEILDIDPNYTIGTLQKEKIETIERLSKENLINANQQLKMAYLPKRIAVISQNGTKGYSDFITLLDKNAENFLFEHLLFEANVNGDSAIDSIVSQLKRIEKVKQHFDLVVIVRGGGNEIGMHCFNNYSLCKEICAFPLPVLTGIGHSTNLTVAEMVAFRNGITPSDTANYLISIAREIVQDLTNLIIQLPAVVETLKTRNNQNFLNTVSEFENEISRRMDYFQYQLEEVSNAFKFCTFQFVNKSSSVLMQKEEALKYVSKNFISEKTQVQDTIASQVKEKSLLSVEKHFETILLLEKQLSQGIIKKTSDENRVLDYAEKTIHYLDPRKVLERGYSIVTNQKGVISEQNEVKVGEKLTILNSISTIETKIEKITKNKKV